MVKYQFSKNWSWCNDLSLKKTSDITDKHVDTVYRIDANQCYFGSCKSNCASNPYCLNGLGEKKLINLLQKEPDAPVERTTYFRNPNEFVGLVNLGATCYINAYLQVWYNNIFFRESILKIPFDKIELEEKYLEDNLANNSEQIPELKIKSNECLATNLQLVFTLMKETVRKSIDPSFFIKALGLDENVQQDAQEFSQLFLTTLQSTLTSQPIRNQITNSDCSSNNSKTFLSSLLNPKEEKNPDLIHELFQGEYQYVTEHLLIVISQLFKLARILICLKTKLRCSNCKLQSVRNSNFIELTLNIQNSQTIKDCIDDLLKDEVMDGDNQYYCDNCKCKRNATRMTKIADLPPILNLQLLRFVYDRNSGYKKKLSSRIKFSEILDLNPYVNNSNDQTSSNSSENLYHLGAILMHVGKTAYSGHYTAQIKNFQSSEWYNFNDEVITKIKKKQQLGCTDDEVETNKNSDDSKKDQEITSSNSKQSIKTFSTANAYLLVYYRADLLDKMPKEESLPMEIENNSNQSQIIQIDNELLENWFSNLQSNKMGQNEIKNTERTFIHSIYELLWLNTCDNSNKNQSGQTNIKKLTARQKASQSKDIIEVPGTTDNKDNKQITVRTTENKSQYYFISIDFIRKFISGDFNQSATDLASCNLTYKYLCSHKRLNPLAINRVKLVSKKGLDQLCNLYSVNLKDIGALEAFNDSLTRCWPCIFSCFDYLKCRDALKQDAKLFKQLLKFEYEINNEKNIRKSLEASEIVLKHYDNQINNLNDIDNNEESNESNTDKNVLNEKNDENDIILIDKQENNHNVNTNGSLEEKIDVKPVIYNNSRETCYENNKENHNSNLGITSTSLNDSKPVDHWYWIGKETLKQWQNLVIKKYESKLPSFKFVENFNEQNGKIDISEETNDNQNEIQEIANIPAQTPPTTATNNVIPTNDSISSSSLNFFNEDIICVHNNLSPTQNKRLICSELWLQIFYKYFFNQDDDNDDEIDDQTSSQKQNEMKKLIFTNESRECKICLKESEDHANKKIQVKNQKDILPELYYNRQRPVILEIEPFLNYYIVMADFIKEWRSLIKHSKFKDIQVFNQTLLCQHGCLPFNELTFDVTMATLITIEEWEYISNNYKCDLPISVIRKPIEPQQFDLEQTNSTVNKEGVNNHENQNVIKNEKNLEYMFEFYPKVCQECMAQNELDKFLFENKKIVIRQIEDEENSSQQVTPLNLSSQNTANSEASNGVSTHSQPNDKLNSNELKSKKTDAYADNDDDCEIIHLSSKKARYENEDVPEKTSDTKTQSSTSNNISSQQSNDYLPTRRSKRSRKCKGDIEVFGSSYSTVKNLKLQIASQLSRMISEQHLYFNNNELDNDKTLMDYKINKGDILYLKLDQVNNNIDDIETTHYAHLPEMGFKGTNLLR